MPRHCQAVSTNAVHSPNMGLDSITEVFLVFNALLPGCTLVDQNQVDEEYTLKGLFYGG